MKQPADVYTGDLLEAPRRGRPRKPDALTPAERARRYRANKRAAKASTPVADISVGQIVAMSTGRHFRVLANDAVVMFEADDGREQVEGPFLRLECVEDRSHTVLVPRDRIQLL